MPRFHPAPAVLEAARAWRDRCLLRDGSLFTDRPLWTAANVDALDRWFVQRPDTGDGDFLTKLEAQLAEADPAARQLAAEMLWLLLLSVYQGMMKGATKRLQIRRVWSWSGEPLPESPLLEEPLETGIANPGTAFQTGRWREMVFLVLLMKAWKALPAAEQRALAGDPWRFATFVDAQPASRNRQFRHMILHLLFPEHFERVVSGGHKTQIVERAGRRYGVRAANGDPISLDRALLDLRTRLEAEFGGEATHDFYVPPLRQLWRDDEGTVSVAQVSAGVADGAPFGGRRVWLLSAGEGARLWPEFRERGIVAIGGFEEDLAPYRSYDDVYAALRAQWGGNPINHARAFWQFAAEMRPGDVVLAKRGRSVLLGVGEVASDYRFDPDRGEYPHVRDVRWDRVGEWTVPDDARMAVKTLTDMTPWPHWLRTVAAVLEEASPDARTDAPPPPPRPDPYTFEDALRTVFVSPERLRLILDTLARKKNVVLEGAPGVGKSFVARHVAYVLLGEKDDSRVETVQFHPSYAYEDFVQGWRPSAGGFELRDGVFHRFCRRAAADPERPYVFLIDELNRGNPARVLGELMLLLEADKRGPAHAIPLTYARGDDDRFHVPANVHVLGTMNTADRSLALMDYALRRRFAFLRLEPAFGTDAFVDHLVRADVPEELVERIRDRMTALNRTIREDRQLGADFEVGHSFFVPDPNRSETLDEHWYAAVVDGEIAPLLREYWVDHPARAEAAIRELRR